MKLGPTHPLIALCWIACALIQGCSAPSVQRMDDSQRDTELARRLVVKGVQAYQAEDYDRAQADLEGAVEADAFSGIAHNNLGLVYFQQGKLYAAAKQFQLAAKLLPYNPEPVNNLGLVLESAGRLDESVGQFEQAMSLQPDNPEFIGNLARARLRQGNNDEQTLELIDELVLKETRPDWLDWARRQQTLLEPTASSSNGTSYEN